jgi:hypothetical protein
MKDLLVRCSLIAAAVAFAFSSTPRCAAQASQKSPQPAADKVTPRAPNGHPDLSGFYNLVDIYKGDPIEERPGQHVVTKTPDGSVFFDYGGSNQGGGAGIRQTQNGKVNMLDRTCGSCENPPYKPEYMAKVTAIGAAMSGDASPLDPQYDCTPYGIPRGSLRGGGGYAMQIVQNASVVAFLYEDRPGPYFRIVYLDGRKHPEDLDKSYFGHSIGHWEGDTLVVDVTGLSDETWLGSGTVGPKLAMMHSDQLHVTERWTRTGDVLTWEATVEDPVMFTKPWVMTPRQTQIAAPDDYIRPTMCLPLDKEHIVKSDNSLYTSTKSVEGSAPRPTLAPDPAAKIAGGWNVQIFSTTQGVLTQQWSLKQDGNNVSGTAKSKSGDLPFDAKMDGASLLGTITDGNNKYEVHGTVVKNDFDGTIKMGKNEWRMTAKRSQ